MRVALQSVDSPSRAATPHHSSQPSTTRSRPSRRTARRRRAAVAPRAFEIVREEQAHATRELVLEEAPLLVDQQLGIAVVAHRHRQVNPGPPGNQVGAERDAAFARRPPASISPGVWPSLKSNRTARPEHRRCGRSTSSSRPLRPRSSGSSGMYDARSRGCGARARSQARLPTMNRARGNSSSGGFALLERREQSAGMIEMQVAQHDDVDVLVRDAARRERAQQHVLAPRARRSALAASDSKNAPMPVSNSTVRPSRSSTSRQRHANSSGSPRRARAIAPTCCAARCRTSRRRRGAGDCLQRTTTARGTSSRAAVATPELQLREPRVQRARGEQLRVRAARDDAAVIHDDDTVGLLHGGQPVRDDDRRALRHELFERLLHEQLALRVERARRLVEQQDRRILENRARDRDALPLPARQPRAALAEERVVALRQRAQELVRFGGTRRGFDLGIAGVRAGRSGCSRAPRRRTAPCPAARGRCSRRTASGSARATSTPSIETRPVAGS